MTGIVEHGAAHPVAARVVPGERLREPGDVEPIERAISERSFEEEVLSTLGVSLEQVGPP